MSHYQKNLGPIQGIAMTVTTFIGAGLMLLPAISVSQAKSSAFYSWIITALLILPIAFVFARLGAKYPSAGGASHYVGKAFGQYAERAVGWLFLSILLVGPTVAIKVTAAYLAIIFQVDNSHILFLNYITLAGMILFAIVGMKTSARFQTMIVIIMLVTTAWLAYIGDIRTGIEQIHTPSSMAQWTQMLLATGSIFWCFLGIEVMAHMGAEFKNPARDFPIALLGGIGIVVITYLVAVILIFQHHTYGNDITNSQSLALLVNQLVGSGTSRFFALGAYIIAFANIAVYLLGFSRMVQSLAQQNALPTTLATLNRQGTPVPAVLLVGGITFLSITFSELSGWHMERFIEMANGTFLTIYLLACFAAFKLFPISFRPVSLLALISCSFIALFIGISMLFAGTMLLLAIGFEYYKDRKCRVSQSKIHVQ